MKITFIFGSKKIGFFFSLLTRHTGHHSSCHRRYSKQQSETLLRETWQKTQTTRPNGCRKAQISKKWNEKYFLFALLGRPTFYVTISSEADETQINRLKLYRKLMLIHITHSRAARPTDPDTVHSLCVQMKTSQMTETTKRKTLIHMFHRGCGRPCVVRCLDDCYKYRTPCTAGKQASTSPNENILHEMNRPTVCDVCV